MALGNNRLVVGVCVAGMAMLAAACRDTVVPFPETYVGVGVELKLVGPQPQVVRVLEGGPAAVAGVEPGSNILAVAGEDTQGKGLAHVVAKLRGPPGSRVTVLVEHDGKSFPLTLTRQSMARDDGGGAYKGKTASRGR